MKIKIEARRWFNKTYGNTYHSVMVSKWDKTLKDYTLIGFTPYRYGYGDAYYNTAAGILGMDIDTLRDRIRTNPQDYFIFCVDVSRKKDLGVYIR